MKNMCKFHYINGEGLFLLLLFIVLIIYVYYVRVFSYWKRKGFPQLQSASSFGEVKGILLSKVFHGTRMKMAYDLIKSKGLTHAGLYVLSFPMYVPISPNILKHILQQDFSHFTEKGFYYNERDDPISANLFALGGEKWKYIRTKLSPSFTVGKIKRLFDILVQCSCQMHETIDKTCAGENIFEIKELAACYTIDVIGSCIYGLDCGSFTNFNSEFKIQGRNIFKSATAMRILKVVLASESSRLANLLGITVFPTETREFFINVVKRTVQYRKENNIVRKDLLHSLMGLMNVTENEKSLTMEQVSAQAFVFFAAGFETSSITISFSLYELAVNVDMQERARREIFQILNNHSGKLSYDSVMEMKYLDQVIDETLRKYPPLAFLTRVCSQDYKLPDSDLVLPKGTHVLISILGLHRDPEYFPDPEKFDPERFSAENRPNIKPYTYIPFGEGPRICIGLRLALLQVKVALISLLSRYKFSVNSKTEEPLVMDPYGFTMVPKCGIYLNVEKI